MGGGPCRSEEPKVPVPVFCSPGSARAALNVGPSVTLARTEVKLYRRRRRRGGGVRRESRPPKRSPGRPPALLSGWGGPGRAATATSDFFSGWAVLIAGAAPPGCRAALVAYAFGPPRRRPRHDSRRAARLRLTPWGRRLVARRPPWCFDAVLPTKT